MQHDDKDYPAGPDYRHGLFGAISLRQNLAENPMFEHDVPEWLPLVYDEAAVIPGSQGEIPCATRQLNILRAGSGPFALSWLSTISRKAALRCGFTP